MCRVLGYVGPPAKISDFLYASDNGLMRQSYEPQLLQMLNLGGFGMLAWDADGPEPEVALSYRSADLPVFDRNLRSLADKFRATCLLAHIRGIAYRADAGFGAHNLHPFWFTGQRWAMAHNGDLFGHDLIKHELLRDIDPELRRQIQGTTDSETIYAMVMSELRKMADDGPNALVEAVRRTVARLEDIRERNGLDRSSSLNLFFSDGSSVVGLRYCFNFGNYPLVDGGEPEFDATRSYLSLWFTMGEAFTEDEYGWRMAGAPDSHGAVLVASEPLTRDVTGWVEVPEYTFLIVEPMTGVSMVEV